MKKCLILDVGDLVVSAIIESEGILEYTQFYILDKYLDRYDVRYADSNVITKEAEKFYKYWED